MIEIKNVTEKFDKLTALKEVSATIEEGHVFGLIGTNGAGKSTLMRSICGVYRPDEGEVLVDGEPVYENPAAKAKLFYISDDQYFFPNGTPMDMVRYYQTIYPQFHTERFASLMEILKLDSKRKINTFSKGMRKQLSVMLGISAGTKYLLCDETFDGLDPVIRQAIKRLFIQEIEENGLTPIIASHNLRELEDICDHVGMMHAGRMLLERSLAELQENIVKVQLVTDQPLPEDLAVLHASTLGRVQTLIIRGEPAQTAERLAGTKPLLCDLLPLSLEEIFMYELGGSGYDVKKLML